MAAQKLKLARAPVTKIPCDQPQFIAVVEFTDNKKHSQEFSIEFAIQPKMGDRFELDDESLQQIQFEELRLREWGIIGITQRHYPKLADGFGTAAASVRIAAMPVDLIWPSRKKK